MTRERRDTPMAGVPVQEQSKHITDEVPAGVDSRRNSPEETGPKTEQLPPSQMLEQILRYPFVHLIRNFEPNYPTFESFENNLSDPLQRRRVFRTLKLLQRTLEMFLATYGDEDLLDRVYKDMHLSAEAKHGRPVREVWDRLQQLCSESTGEASETYRSLFGEYTDSYDANMPAAVRREAEAEARLKGTTPDKP